MYKKPFLKRALKKAAVGLACVAASLGFLFAAGWHIPFPIEGNWLPPLMSCMCTEHKFMRFEDGKIINMSGHPPSTLLGTYAKKGWGRYELNWFISLSHNAPRFVRSTFLRVSFDNPIEVWDGYYIRRFLRDPSYSPAGKF